MLTRIWNYCGWRLPARHCAWTARVILLVALGRLALLPALADGCFVFRWNKDVDIKEPAQKAIIVYDAGREDLLLQVKYEGPLKEFGWLIPVPSLPTVEKGSMRPFYELSKLTQRQWGVHSNGNTLGVGSKSMQEETVKVIEVKTVGAYEVAVLSAQDAGSLERWLKAHDYSIPEGKAGIIDEYIRKGWYFIAAKIGLDKAVSFRRVLGTFPKDAEPSAGMRRSIRKQLSSGELHPLLISFDTPKCIYPLRISAMAGKPSEVSLYVLSAQEMLDKFIYDKGVAKAQQHRLERERMVKEHGLGGGRSMRNLQSLRLANMMYSLTPPGENGGRPARDWTTADLDAIAAESWPDAAPGMLDERHSISGYELLQCMPVMPEEIPQCIKDLPRLEGRSWLLAKQVWTFSPQEMHDLEFQPPVPFLAAALAEPAGAEAAAALTSFGTRADPVLIKACQSTNARERINASSALHAVQDPGLADLLLTLFKDDEPRVRFNALLAATRISDPRFTEPLLTLLRDPHLEIRRQAVVWLGRHETKDRAPAYVALVHDPDSEVQMCALQVLSRIDPGAIPRTNLLQMLGSPHLDTVSAALSLLQGGSSMRWLYRSRISDPRSPTPRATKYLSSAEAAPLTTNRLTLARLMGLVILRENADAQAVALTLPLLRDTNSLVRNRASALLRTVSGQDIPQNDSAKWDQWWAAHKDTFVAPKPAPE